MFDIRHGDCREVLKQLPDYSVDSIVTDPPYELGFMGKAWDSTGVAYQVEVWQECLRVLKVGGHLLAFGGSRTYHRLACAIEDAGFQIRDQIMWVYGSGFPKSLNIGKQEGCETWQGWGTALKPAHEPIVMARKPLVGTVAQTVLTHGTGGINIDGCRVGRADGDDSSAGNRTANFATQETMSGGNGSGGWSQNDMGRFPANFIHDGSDEVLELFPQSNGGAFPKKSNVPTGRHYEGGWGAVDNGSRTEMGDGSAARFFYCAKASKKDRNEGLDGFTIRNNKFGNQKNGDDLGNGSVNDKFTNQPQANHHPTVKPTDLMRYLCRLITPPNGTVLDPFTGSGSTGKAATLEDFNFIGIEQSAEYVEIATARINHAEQQC
jgi:DNA modification methylase